MMENNDELQDSLAESTKDSLFPKLHLIDFWNPFNVDH